MDQVWAGGRSHALNNLLTKIIGSAELALDRVQDGVAREELAAIIALAEESALIVNAPPRRVRPD